MRLAIAVFTIIVIVLWGILDQRNLFGQGKYVLLLVAKNSMLRVGIVGLTMLDGQDMAQLN
jgi:hypothetical protein